MATESRLVLVVEDEVLIRMAVTDALQAAGLEVIDLGSGDEAISMLKDPSDVKVVFTDINMPGTIDGLALIRFVKSKWPRIALFATSGKPSPELLGQLPAGTRFFSKPYDWEELVAAIKARSEIV